MNIYVITVATKIPYQKKTYTGLKTHTHLEPLSPSLVIIVVGWYGRPLAAAVGTGAGHSQEFCK